MAGSGGCFYRLPRLMDVNVASRYIRGRRKLLIVGRCIEAEKPWALERFPEEEYVRLSVCLEDDHVNMAGFKLAGILGRLEFEEVAVLTTDGSMHCIQLHFMVEEVFRLLRPRARRRHFVVEGGRVVEVPPEAVKTARYLSRVARLLSRSRGEGS
ncbi:4Fe-4S ferredoxin [Pyrodictium occultum]|uniref:4Fe-4S ferredoxin n=1 Tax=Pyrodictium occultum TaxID=2309 RepID=UPI001F3B9BA4|nr:4Fe-4S ferredoxin [Pyrodictium occultum]